MQLEWEKTISVGEGKVRGNFSLLTQNVYLRLEDMMSEQIIRGNVRTVGLKLGRIKELLILNGIGWTKVSKNEQKKLLHITHPELNNGAEFEWEITNFESPLSFDPDAKGAPKQPQLITPGDGEWMAGLSDGLAGVIAELNPGLSVDKYQGLTDLFTKTEDDDDSEAGDGGEARENPTESGTGSGESEEDTSMSGPGSSSAPLLAQ